MMETQPSQHIRIEQVNDITSEIRAAIIAPLDEYTRQSGYVWQPTTIALSLVDKNNNQDEGRIVGGLIGNFNFGWLRIEILSVHEKLRGQGWGRRLMEEAERQAIVAGCHHAWVDTFSFQARPFYEQLGYQVFGQLDDYPVGESRYFLSKTLTQPQKGNKQSSAS